MPKEVMDELGLDITKPYHDLFSFDSRNVRCLDLIKDLVINLAQLPMRNMIMDVVVVDIPPKFGLLLSRSFMEKKDGGYLANGSFICSFKLAFQVTNNIAEYEALILGLMQLKTEESDIKVFGDADLIIQQVNKTFQAKHPRLKAYRDEVWRLKDSFDNFCISYIPRVKISLLIPLLCLLACLSLPCLPD
jgi:hypothetical protein